MIHPVPDQRGARAGIAIAVVLMGTLGLVEWCRASDVPPVIIDLRRVVRDARRVLERVDVPAHVMPADGPTCSAPLEVGEDDITESERLTVERQIASCSRRPGRHADAWGLLALVRLEDALGVPDEARGILGAVWCVEGAMRSDRALLGDWLDGRARARGPMQLHGWAWSLCGLDDDGRDDLEASARCYWSRVEGRAAQVEGACGLHTYRVAEALVANATRYTSHGCAARSAHWRELQSWNGHQFR